MSQPSKLHGVKDEFVGSVKENVGKAMGNQQMEAEGKVTKMKGEGEVSAVRGEQGAKATAEKAKGNLKEGVGNLIGNKKMQAEGKADHLKGQVRDKTNY